ncbi:2-hydroxycarboxylate transporter family protein [Clostridium sp. D2Q-14]|uniref:citrate/sodium symporter CitS n=1 Tax=Anaeromonas gelatinilytica TaxID=2683194 RepID=UPI00193C5BCF|nr:2-hydroxycarboxylate transporter family protein [Anaeromonas gelatinilytica]MBS4534333.1 2-hydroxycarboxylate transporter family protein [Anaeromonas gelatinilytica]
MESVKKIKSGKGLKLFGMPVHLFAIFIIVIVAGMATGTLSSDLAGGFAVLFLLGIVFGEIGDRIPIWKEYIGGGSILAFLGSAFLVYKGILPEEYVDSVGNFMGDSDFLTLFISVLITGSILAVNRKLLVRSFIGYVPAILGGLAFAFIFGGLAGLVVGVPFKEVAIKYVLPVMGGGNGAGAIPLSEIWEEVTGQPRDAYYSFAISILTIANIVAIFIGALLNKLGEMRPSLTGDGEEIIRNSKTLLTDEDNSEIPTTHRDVASGLILATMFYSLGRLFAKHLLPSIGGIVIHHFAYMVIFVAVFNALGLIPEELRSGAKKLQKFFTGQFMWVIMAGVGIAYTDLGELVEAITLSNVFIASFVVIGAVLGSAIVGYFVGFFPVDTAVTAGLCMANRGGSGDIAVLGASKRMGLISYGQISSRIGGGIVLVVGSIVFGLMF